MRIPLAGGFYKARDLIVSAQRCVNLYPEINERDAAFPITCYPTPGLVSLGACPTPGVARGMYLASNGKLYVCVGSTVWNWDPTDGWSVVGSIATDSGPVSMIDNRQVLLVVDGTEEGYTVDLENNSFAPIENTAFLGATRADYIDTFFVFNNPGTNQFYATASNINVDSLTSGPIVRGTILSGGSGYASKVVPGVVLSANTGTGMGAAATVTAAGGVINGVTITSPGSGYKVGDVLVIPAGGFPTAGPVLQVKASSFGTGIAPGTYNNIATTGGTGTGLRLNITVGSTFQVTSFSVANSGSGYASDDVVTVTLPAAPTPPPTPFVPPQNPPALTQPSFVTFRTGGTSGGFQYQVDEVNTDGGINRLDIASKAGSPDNLTTILVVRREIWLFGEKTTEVWQNTGAADFPFGIIPGVFIEHGCLAPYSVASIGNEPFWLGNDEQGRAVVYVGRNYQAGRVSTHAIEGEFQKYSRLDDAVAFTHQIDGHYFYVLNFPIANKTWVYDLSCDMWHERVYISNEGTEERHLVSFYANAFGRNLCIHRDTGEMMEFSNSTYNDLGRDVTRIRTFPHIFYELNKITYSEFAAYMSSGNSINTLESNPELVFLRWSDDGGVNFRNPVPQSLGSTGQTNNIAQWTRLGLGRNRVFELSWSANAKTSISGAYIQYTIART